MASGTVLVTGSSSGIGLATCVELAARGYHVLASMRDTARSQRLVRAVEASGAPGAVEVVALDVAAGADCVEERVRTLAQACGGLDALVNNAGIAAVGPVETVREAEWRRVMETNFYGALACIRGCLRGMRERGSGTIVNVTSINGRLSPAGLGPYSASKFALEAASEALRLELHGTGVRVVVVEPGQYVTDIWARPYDVEPDERSPYHALLRELSAMRAPPAGAADPSEVAGLIADILVDPAPTLRYAIGPVAGMTADALIQGHLTRPWSELEASYTGS